MVDEVDGGADVGLYEFNTECGRGFTAIGYNCSYNDIELNECVAFRDPSNISGSVLSCDLDHEVDSGC